MNLDNEPTNVDVNTDDLDAFTDLMYGKTSAVDTSEVPETKPVVEDDTTEPETSDNAENTETDQDDTDTTRDSNQDDNDGKENKPKKVNRVQERINQLLERERKKEEENASLRQRLAELESKQNEPAPKTPAPTVEDDGPNPEDTEKYPLGEFDPQYIRDLTRHTLQKEREALREQEAKERQAYEEQQARAELDTQWRSKLETVTQQHEDFLDKTIMLESAFEGIDANYADYLVQTIKGLDHGPEVLYYFANNLDEAQRFVRMGPMAATLALGEYNAMFKGQTRKETKVSNAPPPPQLNKGTNTRKVVAPDTDNLDDFETLLFNKSRK